MFLVCLLPSHLTQPTGDVTAVQGLTLTLQCTLETSSNNPTLFWYKQEVNDYPRYMLQRLISGSETIKAPEFQDERFDTEINKTSFPLKIQKLHVSDSAVYYCAVRPTVTGNSKTLNKNLWMSDCSPRFNPTSVSSIECAPLSLPRTDKYWFK
uniref:Ig-like domain-containing protein n=1 Tax=Sphaeramia orbicularis TaxID=375764 RepID=A0A672YEB6_9TELE